MEPRQSSSTDMPPPVSANTCALGQHCGGVDLEENTSMPNPEADLCGWCRNVGFRHLYNAVEIDQSVKSIVIKHWDAVKSEADAFKEKGLYVCALRDPDYAYNDWRTEFIPDHGNFLCDNPVSEKGLLCRRCQAEVKRMLDEDKNSLPILRVSLEENRKVGFPCIMRDKHFGNDAKNMGWKRGFHELMGKLTPEEELEWFDKNKHVCLRADREYKLCDNCYERMHHDKARFDIFFDKDRYLRIFIGKFTS
ncbi:hypothetical protein K505DRAFT_338660 [Melanomma pulvis-pyrius CBS 109.77]|uniref:Uncharacterized protein n=1 Tax=Melanomma pulvis-pyrius CBS 109.77 TaxID=1314802 RepID=A0A6A6X7Z7_9PLEO|nr:hypothetical protein K505DRAFT_338660 [Melanomma pulvis-pyrius CBS 109.77]